MGSQEITQAELEEIRKYRREQNRRFWNRMTAEERRQKRQQYDLARARKAQERAQEKRNEVNTP